MRRHALPALLALFSSSALTACGHWLARHAAVEALAAHARAGGDDLMACVPRSVHDPAVHGEGGEFMGVVRVVLARTPAPGGACAVEAAADASAAVSMAADAVASAVAAAAAGDCGLPSSSAAARLGDALAALAEVEAAIAAGGASLSAAAVDEVAAAASRIKRRCVA
jgi:hypothetical protein